jgi:hypothetical protein
MNNEIINNATIKYVDSPGVQWYVQYDTTCCFDAVEYIMKTKEKPVLPDELFEI